MSLHTPDRRYIAVHGRLWRAVKATRSAQDADAEAAAHDAANAAKQALGECRPVWWDDGAPDLRNTGYAEWYAA